MSRRSRIGLKIVLSVCVVFLKCSLKSKVYLINTKIVSPIIYLSSSHIISKCNLNKIDKYILKFFWDDKPAKIKNKVIMNQIEHGGLKVPCFSLKYLALRGFWIKEGLKDTIQLWKEFVHHDSGFSINDLIISGSGLNTFKNISLFYREILEIARGLINNRDSDLLIIENQRLNINENLAVNGGVFTNINLNNSKLRDIIHTDGRIFTAQEIMDKFHVNAGMGQLCGQFCAIMRIIMRSILLDYAVIMRLFFLLCGNYAVFIPIMR